MNLKYMLIGQTPVPVEDTLEWAHWFESSHEQRVVGRLEYGDMLISTIFLALDHNFSQDGPPILFETMIFADGDSIYEDRCSTWLEAEEMHEKAIAFAASLLTRTSDSA